MQHVALRHILITTRVNSVKAEASWSWGPEVVFQVLFLHCAVPEKCVFNLDEFSAWLNLPGVTDRLSRRTTCGKHENQYRN